MVWGMCSWSDMRPLIRLDTTLTGDTYLWVWRQPHESMDLHVSRGLFKLLEALQWCGACAVGAI
jgi:hypothetical protein